MSTDQRRAAQPQDIELILRTLYRLAREGDESAEGDSPTRQLSRQFCHNTWGQCRDDLLTKTTRIRVMPEPSADPRVFRFEIDCPYKRKRGLTVFHTHGWSPKCRNCRPEKPCPLTDCTPSLQDYQLLETLLPSKATLLPIAGRAAGGQGEHPVLGLYAWQGGEMRAIPWRTYTD